MRAVSFGVFPKFVRKSTNLGDKSSEGANFTPEIGDTSPTRCTIPE